VNLFRVTLILTGVALPAAIYSTAGCSSSTTQGFGDDAGSKGSSSSGGSSGGNASSSSGSSSGGNTSSSSGSSSGGNTSSSSGGSSGGSSGSSSGGTTGGACSTQCAASYCMMMNPTPGDACDTCINDSLSADAGGTCLAPLESACPNGGVCDGWLTCAGGCPTNGQGATAAYDGGVDTATQCNALASQQDCVNCCATNNMAGYNAYFGALTKCVCGQ
jgi:hypothetical protein